MNNTTEFPHGLAKCVALFQKTDENEYILFTAVYGSLIPLIIVANLLLIIGINKTKRSKLTSSQILFSTLFVSDLTIAVVQMPSNIYILWKSSEPTCFEVQLNVFFASFPINMSLNLLCVISIERYIYVVYNGFYRRTVTKKLLAIGLVCLILISFIWATTDAHLRAKRKSIIVKTYFALTAYSGTVLAIGILCNVALLRNVKRKTQKSSVQQTLDSSLTKTIGLIIGIMVAAYLPVLIALNVVGYAYISSPDKPLFKKRGNALLWALMLSQFNAVLNSVVYLLRNIRMRRYYSKFFNCRNKENKMKQVGPRGSNVPSIIINSI